MANEEHVRVLLEGTSAIEKYRAQQKVRGGMNIDVPLDLRGASLIDATLKHAPLRWCDFTKAKLCNANLWHAYLIECTLDDADLKEANLCYADLTGSSMVGTNLRGAVLLHARGVNLTGARGYVLDGEDMSSWVLPPSPLLPIIEHVTASAEGVSVRRRFGWPYTDPWSALRRTYTGVMTAFHLLLGITALAPHVLQATLGISNGDTQDYSRFEVLLGWHKPEPGLLVASSGIIIGYNVLRIGATWYLSQLREEEARSHHAPRKSQYLYWWIAHQWFMRWAALLAVGLSIWRTCCWLSEPV